METHPLSLSEKEPVRAIVLAAGSGTLPGTDIPLLLHPLAGKAIEVKPRRSICYIQGFVADKMVFEAKITGMPV